MSAYDLPQPYRCWRELVEDLGFVDILSIEDSFRTCLETGRPWSHAATSGIYCWIAANGEAYVGKTTHARNRLMAHVRDHADLRYAAFLPAHADELDKREAELISRVNEVLPIRNIKLALQSASRVPFDQLVTTEEREAFLRGEPLPEDGGRWRELPLLEQKQARKFAKFLRLHDSDEIVRSLSCFVQSVLPKPTATEGRFWSVSLLQSETMLRVNVGQQEVFTIIRGIDGLSYARSLALEAFADDSEGPLYQTRSYDHLMPLADLSYWLTGRRLLSVRQLAVWLMRHTTALNFASHCPQLLRHATVRSSIEMD